MNSTFKSFISKTGNIPELLKKAAKKFDVPLNSVDFDILKITTGIKLPQYDSFAPINDAIKEKIKDDKFLLKRQIDIKETYEINVRPKLANEPIKLVLDVGVDKFHSKATGTLKKESKFHSTDSLFENLLGEIHKKMVKLGILIGVRNEPLETALKEIIPKIISDGFLMNDIKIPLSHWVTPTPTVHDKLIFHYNKQETFEDENGNIDYANRGFVKEVKTGDLIVEHVVPKTGFPGRGFNGRYFKVAKPQENYKKAFLPDPATIEVVEKENGNTEYIAKKDGFIKISDKVLKVGSELDLEAINFKETGNIVTDLDKNITIKTGGSGEDDDIGSNMKVKTSNIDVAGNVGSHAEINAVNVIVRGQTHQTSKIECKNAKITNLRGELKCEKAKIDSLEGGVVHANSVVIKKLKGGKVYAKEVKIGSLGVNNHIRAVVKVHILKTEEGGENIIVMDPGATKNERIRIRTLLSQREELNAAKQIVERKYNNINNVILRNQKSAEELKVKIDAELEGGRQPNIAFINKYKTYLKDLKKCKELRAEFKEADTKLKQKNIQISRVQSNVLKAVIQNEDIWRGYNKISFKTLAPPMEYEYLPEENEYATAIRLKQKNIDDVNEGFEIKAMGTQTKETKK